MDTEKLDKIQNMVEDKFQDIRNTDGSCFHCPGQPCTSEHLQVCIQVINFLHAKLKLHVLNFWRNFFEHMQ